MQKESPVRFSMGGRGKPAHIMKENVKSGVNYLRGDLQKFKEGIRKSVPPPRSVIENIKSKTNPLVKQMEIKKELELEKKISANIKQQLMDNQAITEAIMPDPEPIMPDPEPIMPGPEPIIEEQIQQSMIPGPEPIMPGPSPIIEEPSQDSLEVNKISQKELSFFM